MKSKTKLVLYKLNQSLEYKQQSIEYDYFFHTCVCLVKL